VDFKLPEGVQAKVENNTHIVLTGSDKMILGMAADKIRAVRPPEPYQGKGIRYTNEHIVKKAGKAAGGGK
jgi:large subunit ribosomal protein L6